MLVARFLQAKSASSPRITCEYISYQYRSYLQRTSMLAGGTVATLTALRGFGKVAHEIELRLHHRHDDQLRNTLHGLRW
jgi:hypothetical protein